MNRPKSDDWSALATSPRLRSAIGGMIVGAVLSLVLVAGPLLAMRSDVAGGGSSSEAAPLAALATIAAEPAEFDISKILDGNWVGEMCDNDGDAVPVRLEFVVAEDDSVSYSLLADGDLAGQGIVGSGSCHVDGEEISFHAFLAVLTDCKDVCGVDRSYEGQFDDGALVGTYDDGVIDEDCRSCIGGGTWWLAPER